jgi:hypothetical protein
MYSQRGMGDCSSGVCVDTSSVPVSSGGAVSPGVLDAAYNQLPLTANPLDISFLVNEPALQAASAGSGASAPSIQPNWAALGLVLVGLLGVAFLAGGHR